MRGSTAAVDVQRRYLWKTLRAQAERHSGIGQKVFGFSPEFVFAFSPEWCSASARNPVRFQQLDAVRRCSEPETGIRVARGLFWS
jgi:hypothetical protein